MSAKVVTFGEIMLRLSPPGFERLLQSPVLSATFGGGEANVAASLAHFGLESHYVTRLPAHATSTGRVLLAALGPREVGRWLKGRVLPRLTPHTVVDAGELRARIDRVRRDDFAIAREEHEPGVLALAVPLRNMKGATLAALNVVVSPQRMDEGELQRTALPLLLEASRELRSLL